MITATFSITLTGKFLPIHLIYSGKTKNIPAVSFPSDFVISANETHYSNEREALNMLGNVIIPYVEKQRVSLNLDFDHPALLIMDVSKGQMTCPVRELLNENQNTSGKGPSESDILVSASRCARRSEWLREAFYEEKVYALVLRTSDTCP